jgi:hypothetical protein
MPPRTTVHRVPGTETSGGIHAAFRAHESSLQIGALSSDVRDQLELRQPAARTDRHSVRAANRTQFYPNRNGKRR